MAQDTQTPGWPLASESRAARAVTPAVDPEELVIGPTTSENELIVLDNAARQGWRPVSSDGVQHTLRWGGDPLEVTRMDHESARAVLAAKGADGEGWTVAAVRDDDALLVRLRRAGRRFALRSRRPA